MFQEHDVERRLIVPSRASFYANYLDPEIEFTAIENTPYYRDFYQVDEMQTWIQESVTHFYESGQFSKDNQYLSIVQNEDPDTGMPNEPFATFIYYDYKDALERGQSFQFNFTKNAGGEIDFGPFEDVPIFKTKLK